MATHQNYTKNVFIKCPFDSEYDELREAIIFAIFDCGFIPRCAMEVNNAADVRVNKIHRLIEESKYGLHDLSRVELDSANSLPRFNMPLELGLFLGAKRFGSRDQKSKNCLILDSEQFRFQKYISDIAGSDTKSHENQSNQIITHIRNWLSDASGKKSIPGGSEIIRRYKLFLEELPVMASTIKIEPEEMTYNDYTNFISFWLQGDEQQN